MPVDVVEAGEVASIGVVITAAASPLVLRLLKRYQVMDIPSDRSSHVLATPRGGGLACLLGLMGAVALAPGLSAGPKLLLLASGGVLAVLGFVDDLRHLTVRLRFSVQLVVAAVASGWALHLSWPTSAGAVALAGVGALWIAAYVNAFNFMDGINGLAGAATAVAGLTFAAIGLRRSDATLAFGGAACTGTALAFLPWNFPQARFFLGDVGSYLLGGTIALLVLVGLRAHVPPEALLGPEAVFVADTGWTLLGRISRGEDWTSAHRTHVYQQLQKIGISHARATLTVTTLMVATSVLGLVSLTDVPWARLLADPIALVLLVAYLASPTVLRRPVASGGDSRTACRSPR